MATKERCPQCGDLVPEGKLDRHIEIVHPPEPPPENLVPWADRPDR